MIESDIMSIGSSSFTSKCPGAIRWRTLSNGQIEVEGVGVPRAPTTGYHADGKFVTEVWNKWKPEILAAASASGIPATWILAVMIVESRGKNYAPNSAGAGGLMALMVPAATIGLNKLGYNRKATSADVADPATNVMAGAGYMRYNADLFGWELPIVADAHNAGAPKCSPTTRCKDNIDGGWNFDGTTAQNSMGMVEDCTQGRSSAYAMRTVQINNSAIDLGIGGGGFMGLDEGVALAIAGAAFVGALYYTFPEQFDAGMDYVFGGWLEREK